MFLCLQLLWKLIGFEIFSQPQAAGSLEYCLCIQEDKRKDLNGDMAQMGLTPASLGSCVKSLVGAQIGNVELAWNL